MVFGRQVLWAYLEDQIELSDHNKVTNKTLPLFPVHKRYIKVLIKRDAGLAQSSVLCYGGGKQA
jgi:hypothetical protein